MTTQGPLFLVADGSSGHEPDTDREERREDEDTGENIRSGRGELGKKRWDECEEQEGNDALFSEGV